MWGFFCCCFPFPFYRMKAGIYLACVGIALGHMEMLEHKEKSRLGANTYTHTKFNYNT